MGGLSNSRLVLSTIILVLLIRSENKPQADIFMVLYYKILQVLLFSSHKKITVISTHSIKPQLKAIKGATDSMSMKLAAQIASYNIHEN
jgi:hypothetical protein